MNRIDPFARARSLALTFEPSETVLTVRQGFQIALKGQIVASVDGPEPTLYDELWMEIVQSTVVAAYTYLATTLPTSVGHLKAASLYMPYGVNSPAGIDVTGNKEALSAVAMSIARMTVHHPMTPNEVLQDDLQDSSVTVEFKTGAGTIEKFNFTGPSVYAVWSRITRMHAAIIANRAEIKIPGRFRRAQQQARALADEQLFTSRGKMAFSG